MKEEVVSFAHAAYLAKPKAQAAYSMVAKQEIKHTLQKNKMICATHCRLD